MAKELINRAYYMCNFPSSLINMKKERNKIRKCSICLYEKITKR